ncbi:MAG: hypothetical protein U0736_13035 [Gemmataceae bacterium]
MYEDPDQDLNKVWWDLVEKYQQVRRPAGRNAPDYAGKVHIVVAPVYYHNYMMGELFASQVHRDRPRRVRRRRSGRGGLRWQQGGWRVHEEAGVCGGHFRLARADPRHATGLRRSTQSVRRRLQSQVTAYWEEHASRGGTGFWVRRRPTSN